MHIYQMKLDEHDTSTVVDYIKKNCHVLLVVERICTDHSLVFDGLGCISIVLVCFVELFLFLIVLIVLSLSISVHSVVSRLLFEFHDCLAN